MYDDVGYYSMDSIFNKNMYISEGKERKMSEELKAVRKEQKTLLKETQKKMAELRELNTKRKELNIQEWELTNLEEE